jgi:hypothetical protein
MSFLFDDISRVIASEFPRRKMLSMLGAAVGGAVMGSLALRSEAFAQIPDVPNCGHGEILCNGKCCSGTCQNGRCCEKNTVHCGFECCGSGLLCCNGHCCTCKTAVCFRGFCCESGVICAGKCCELDEFCVDGKCRRVISPTSL